MATYNGAKFIKQQLESIINQTQRVDEIVISDDGSTDGTLEIIKEVSKLAEKNNIEFVTIHHNQKHGHSGNFEYALKHCTGDYIFLADQDDVWLPDKVECVIKIIYAKPVLLCVFHKKKNIDKFGNLLPDLDDYLVFNEGEITKENYLEYSVSDALCSGMVMCISKYLLDIAIPFPQANILHDQWLLFCALCIGNCYYLNRVLALYRMHDNNVTAKYHGSLKGRISKVNKRLTEYRHFDASFVVLGAEMKKMLLRFGLEKTMAFDTAEHICRIGAKQKEAFESNKIAGSIKLIRLFAKDKRYRKCGTNAFLYQLAGILTR